MNRELAYQCAILFLLVVAAGLLLILLKEHPVEQVAISPLTPAASSPVICVPPASHYQFKQRRIA